MNRCSVYDFHRLFGKILLGSARVAELVDALASGASVRKDVEVQVLSRAPGIFYEKLSSEMGDFSLIAHFLICREEIAGCGDGMTT